MRNPLERIPFMQSPRPGKGEQLPHDYGWLQKQYIHFCQSKFAGKQEPTSLIIDLQNLMAMPEITHITFSENNQGLEMLLATTHVHLLEPLTNLEYSIGRFVVRINRRAKYVVYTNIDGGLCELHDGIMKTVFHHPHINYQGIMCVTQGKEELLEHLCDGKMYDAARIIVRMLWTIDSFPFPDARLEHWPLKETTHEVT